MVRLFPSLVLFFGVEEEKTRVGVGNEGGIVAIVLKFQELYMGSRSDRVGMVK